MMIWYKVKKPSTNPSYPYALSRAYPCSPFSNTTMSLGRPSCGPVDQLKLFVLQGAEGKQTTFIMGLMGLAMKILAITKIPKNPGEPRKKNLLLSIILVG